MRWRGTTVLSKLAEGMWRQVGAAVITGARWTAGEMQKDVRPALQLSRMSWLKSKDPWGPKCVGWCVQTLYLYADPTAFFTIDE